MSHNFQYLDFFPDFSYDLRILRLIFGALLFHPTNKTSQDNRLRLNKD